MFRDDLGWDAVDRPALAGRGLPLRFRLAPLAAGLLGGLLAEGERQVRHAPPRLALAPLHPQRRELVDLLDGRLDHAPLEILDGGVPALQLERLPQPLDGDLA